MYKSTLIMALIGTTGIQTAEAQTPGLDTEVQGDETVTRTVTSEVGTGPGLEMAGGWHGSLAFVEGGVRLPRILRHLTSGLKLSLAGSNAAAAFTNLETGQTMSLRPLVLGGTISLGGSSDLMLDMFRPYGGVDLFVGTTVTPHAFLNRDETMIGSNLTYGWMGTVGIELLTSEHWSTFFEAGGGSMSLMTIEEDRFSVASSTRLSHCATGHLKCCADSGKHTAGPGATEAAVHT